jgi:hypothetical protein
LVNNETKIWSGGCAQVKAVKRTKMRILN